MNTQTIEKEVHPIEEWDDFELAEGLDGMKNAFVMHYNPIIGEALEKNNQPLAKEAQNKLRRYQSERRNAIGMTTEEKRKLLRRWKNELGNARKNPMIEFSYTREQHG